MRRRREWGRFCKICLPLAGTILAGFFLAFPANAALLPPGFFDTLPSGGSGKANVEANNLDFNRKTNTVSASGAVVIGYNGYQAYGDRLDFNQNSGDINLVGNVKILGPDGTEYSANSVKVTGRFKDALVDELVLVTTDGAMVTAAAANHVSGDRTILDDSAYAPCGTCIDAKGRRIGWRVRAAKIVYNAADKTVELHEPVLELFGMPIAWLPYLRVPDPSNPRASGFRLPSVAFGEKIGVKIDVPYFYSIDENRELIFTPTLLSRQGLMLGAGYGERLPGLGEYTVAGAVIYQLDRGAFAGTIGDLDWRGYLQTTGHFTPTPEWTAGWSYTAFTDPGYLLDYQVTTANPVTNEVYAQYLTPDTYADVRVQEFRLLGDISAATQAEQAVAAPKGRIETRYDLGEGNGDFVVSGDFLGLYRDADSTTTANGVAYVKGYQGTKTHAMLQTGWTDQWITPVGAVATPYAGLRLDAATYDGASAINPVPSELFSATPIAALDVRYPLVAHDGASTHLIEPVIQLVYRGAAETKPGINNDNAQSFAFDETNLFSPNRFSGTDRQETGFRANIGGHYQATFEDGSYLDFAAGQSFHLADANGLAVSDTAQVGTSTGLGGTASNIVAGVTGGFGPVAFGAKAQLDPATTALASASIAGSFADHGWRVGADYSYIRANPALGTLVDQHDIGGTLTVPLADYWSATASTGYDLTAGVFIDHSASIDYDDGYVAIGAIYEASGPDLFNPAAKTFKLSFKLKAPDGTDYGQ